MNMTDVARLLTLAVTIGVLGGVILSAVFPKIPNDLQCTVENKK